MLKKSLLIFSLVMVAASVSAQQMPAGHAGGEKNTDDVPETGFFSPGSIVWKTGPGSLPSGAKFSVLEGDPAKEGPFVMRLWLPDGFMIPPHWHPKVERITVISGSFNLGMGEKFEKGATRELTAGSFGFWAAGMRHFAWVKGDTVLQLHGIGPWAITYVNPADDPRNAKK